jgi:hypothetical protein
MAMIRWTILLALAATLLACGSEPPPPPVKTEPAPTVLDDQLKAMDKARAVEDLEMERKRKMDEQLDDGG